MGAQEESQLRAALAAMSLRERLGGPCPVHLKAEELLSMAGRGCPERWAVVYLAVEEFDKIAGFLGRQEFVPTFRIFYHDSKTGFTSVHLNPSRSHYALQYCIYRGMQKRMDSTFWRNQPMHEMQRVYKLRSYTAAQPDFSFLPHDLGIAKQHFPTFIMETSWELTLDELRAKVRWWFRGTQGSVRVALLVCVEPGPRGCIIIEKWSAARADSTLKELFIPTRKRLIRITPATPDYDSNGDPVATRSKPARVTGGPLEIKFDDVMLRERSLHLREPTRFVFRDQFFQKYATEVWTHAERRYTRQSTVT